MGSLFQVSVWSKVVSGNQLEKSIVSEPRHDKIQQNECAPSEDSDQPGVTQSDQSLRCPHEESLRP